MINYIIINGVNSNTITGLAINELPPITKPLMRTTTDEIDGRDGDIITKLGYSAYDKTITIGLWGTGYDVNSIISFFNKKGTITFSNEADKYYNFTMVEQFDIESLLRFKSASITFHCQPFKYPIEETPIEIAYEYIEQDNVESATLNNTNGDKHLDITLKGNTSQYTTTGKNLIDTSTTTTVKNNNGADRNGYYYQVNQTGSYYIYVYPVNDDLYYGKSTNLSNASTSLGSAHSGITKTATITLNAGEYFVIWGVSNPSNNDKIMIAYGSETSFEPYTNGASPNPSYPQPINVVSGDNEIKVVGKNLLNPQLLVSAYGLTYDSATGYFTGTCSGYSEPILLELETPQYLTFSYKGTASNQSVFFAYTYEDDTTGTYYPWSNSDEYTLSPNKKIKKVEAKTRDTSHNNNFRLMIELGQTGTPYTPYQSQTYHITLPNGMELCKIGNYQDYFYKDSGKWYLHKETKSRSIPTFTELISGTLFGTPCKYGNANISDILSSGRNYNYFSNKIHYAKQNNVESYSPYGSYVNATNIIIMAGENDTLTDFNNNLSGGVIYYPLATSTDTEITDTTLINQLDNIQNALSYEGQTNVSQVNNDKPFIMDLIAMKDGTDEVVVNNIGNTTSKPTIALEGTGDINIYLDGTQMLKATLTDKMTIDTNNLEAYNPDTMTLLNRQLVGDISKFTLASGNNTIKVDGNLTKATITNYERWL